MHTYYHVHEQLQNETHTLTFQSHPQTRHNRQIGEKNSRVSTARHNGVRIQQIPILYVCNTWTCYNITMTVH